MPSELVLHPSRLRRDLLVLLLGDRDDSAGPVEQFDTALTPLQNEIFTKRGR